MGCDKDQLTSQIIEEQRPYDRQRHNGNHQIKQTSMPDYTPQQMEN